MRPRPRCVSLRDRFSRTPARNSCSSVDSVKCNHLTLAVDLFNSRRGLVLRGSIANMQIRRQACRLLSATGAITNEATGKEKRRLDQRNLIKRRNTIGCFQRKKSHHAFHRVFVEMFSLFVRFPWPSPTNGTSFPPNANSKFQGERTTFTGSDGVRSRPVQVYRRRSLESAATSSGGTCHFNLRGRPMTKTEKRKRPTVSARVTCAVT